MPGSPRFPKPGKRPWRTAWRSEPLRDKKDVRAFLITMSIMFGFILVMYLWTVMGD